MNRRRFVGLAAAALPFGSRSVLAQSQAKPTIGILSGSSPDNFRKSLDAFDRGLKSERIVVGQNAAIDHRWVNGRYEQFPEIAAQLVRDRASVIVPTHSAAARALKLATTQVPIVFALAQDPVEAGLVSSLNRPESNLTGVNYLNSQLGPKQLQMMLEAVPGAKTLGFLANPNSRISMAEAELVTQATKKISLTLSVQHASNDDDLLNAFANLRALGAGGLIVCSDAFFSAKRDKIIALATTNRLPTIYDRPEYVEAGGLMSYGGSQPEMYYQVGILVGKILNGAQVSSLPIHQSTKIVFSLNMKAAKEIGITIPPALMVRADEIIE